MAHRKRNPEDLSRLRRALLGWYDCNRRDLPWRGTSDPYAIWVSEVMLQQTRVAVVIERYKSFVEQLPTVSALAEADEQEVLALWSGLGYYRRARMLHKAAQVVAGELDGRIPASAAELRKLPGIGAYTAAAIASIAGGEHVAVVDGNVERVVSRLQGWDSASTADKAAIRRKVEEFASELVDPSRPGDFNQALMELGAIVCTPRSPECPACPWTDACTTKGEHRTPGRPGMTSTEVACALVLRGADSRSQKILIEQRPATETVMANMWQLPFLRDPEVPERELRMVARHAIMQVNYTVRVRDVAEDKLDALADRVYRRRWVAPAEAERMALTGLTRKVLVRAGFLHAPIAQERADDLS
jgi:A/G-specific adenine glycosylase